jgi:methionine sulfoxide reductase heme-binding subunit
MNLSLTDGHLFWITSRAAGTAALVFSTFAVGLGLAMSLKLLRGRGLEMRVIHEALSLATMLAIVVHGLSLVFDKFFNQNLFDISVPFVSGFREPWMAIGIIGGWALIALGLAYYARGRIGVERWRRLHRLTALAWLAGVVHTFGEGTDAWSTWFLICTGALIVPAAALLCYRHATESPDTQRVPVRGARLFS